MPLLFAMLDVSVTYSLIFFCSYKIWAQVRQELSSEQATAVQRQLNYTLAVQVSISIGCRAFFHSCFVLYTCFLLKNNIYLFFLFFSVFFVVG